MWCFTIVAGINCWIDLWSDLTDPYIWYRQIWAYTVNWAGLSLIWGFYQNWVDPLDEYSWWPIVTRTVQGICTMWIMQQLSYMYCRSCSFIIVLFVWIFCWKSLVILFLCVAIGTVGCNISAIITLSSFMYRVIGTTPGSHVLAYSSLLPSIQGGDKG